MPGIEKMIKRKNPKKDQETLRRDEREGGRRERREEETQPKNY